MASREEIERIHNEMASRKSVRVSLAEGDEAYREFLRKKENKTRAEQDELLRLDIGLPKEQESSEQIQTEE